MAKEASSQFSLRAASFNQSLSAIAQAMATMGNTVGRVLADGKIETSEYFDLILATPNVLTVIKEAPRAAKDWLVVSDDERAAVVAEFSARFDIANDVAEMRIETTLNEASKLYSSLTKAVKSIKTVYGVWSTPANPA